MKFNTRYKREYKASRIEITEPSLAKQSFAQEADINTIVGRVLKGGMIPTGERKPNYGDFVGLDYQAMQNQIAQVNQSFAELPSLVRRRFDNDPAAMLSFLQDPENAEEAAKLGLIPGPDLSPDPAPDLPDPVKTTPAEPAKTT